MSIFARSGNLEDFWRQTPVTSIIFILNTLMLLAVLVTGGFDGSVSDWAFINRVLILEDGQYYRIITGAFHHWSFMHFLFNMVIGIIVLSSALERTVGSKAFSVVYFGSLLASSTLITFVSSDFARTAGASGAIFGVLGALLWITIYRKDLVHPRDIQSIIVLVLFQVGSTFLTPGVSIIGHISGIASGFLISYLVIRRNIFKVLH